jgi:hypothetical protein
MLTDGDRAVLCARVTAALERHETGHSAHGLRIAFMAGSVSAWLIAGRATTSAHRAALEAVFNESLIERERAAARTILAIIRCEPDANARLAKLEAL